MEPKHNTVRSAFRGGPLVSVSSVNDKENNFDIDETGTFQFLGDQAPEPEEIDKAEEESKKMADEEIKIKALNLSVNIAKLMSDVTTDDILGIASKIAVFIKEE